MSIQCKLYVNYIIVFDKKYKLLIYSFIIGDKNMFIMKLKPEYFDLIKSGKKVYEVRLLDEKRRQFKLGDSLLLKKEPELLEGIVVKIIEVKYFNTFLEMAKTLSISGLGFDDITAEEVDNIYHSIYSREDEEKYGVVAFKLELV